jgi:hypothetical protein
MRDKKRGKTEICKERWKESEMEREEIQRDGKRRNTE